MASKQKAAAFVTGAARGIGRGIAARLLAAGWNVLIADVLVKEGKAATKELNDKVAMGGTRAVFVRCDVTSEKQIAAAVARAKKEFGRLDALVNNAGIPYPYNAPVEKLSRKDWNSLLDVNLTGPFLCTKHATPMLRQAPDGGSIVNISSTRAFQAEKNTETYHTSKAGLLGLTRSLALSLGPEVRVNAICPGWIDTRPPATSAALAKAENHAQHPVGRVGRPDDIAELTLFLIEGKRSGFITGQTYICDGGMSVRMIYEH